MNERIKLLAEQAGLLPREIGPVVETRHMKKKEQDLEKFAELIVRECMGQVWYTREDGINGNVSEVIKNRIKQHFGVEE